MISEEAIVEKFRRQNTCVIVPTYNNASTLKSVIAGVLKQTQNVIIINDGSTDETSGILNEFPFLESVSYKPNQGKGVALRKGFEKALELGYDYAITIDSDGQHFPDDMSSLLKLSKSNPGKLIIGSRNMDQDGVPGKSSFGNRFSNFWFWVETGSKLPDTQSGYRLYPVSRLKGFNFITKKFEFEIEVLVKAAWAGIEILPCPVQVHYEEKEKRVSHFRPFTDFARISILNTFLVLIALFYIKPRDLIRKVRKDGRQALHELITNPHETNRTKAVSVGFGVFMGIVPIWGFQMMVALALSFVFRLNKIIVLVAANISIPPMIPLILYLSHLTGKIWMGSAAVDISFDKELTISTLRESFIQYVLGSITLATASGIFFGIATYLFLKVFKGKKEAVPDSQF